MLLEAAALSKQQIYNSVRGQRWSALRRRIRELCLDEDLLHTIVSGLELLVDGLHVLDPTPMADHLQRVNPA